MDIKILEDLISFKSISSDVAYSQEVKDIKSYLIKLLKKYEFKVKTLGVNNSIIYAKRFTKASNKTLLIYGHYDVVGIEGQKWDSDPFTLTTIKNKIIARGISDNKGQLYINLMAVLDLLQTKNIKNLNIIFLVEGEEEVSGPALKAVLKNGLDEKIDYVLISDSLMISKNLPTIISSLRGNISFEIQLTTAKQEEHSGLYGGALPNAANLALELHNRAFNNDFLNSLMKGSKPHKDLVKSSIEADQINFNKTLKSLNVQSYCPKNASVLTTLTPSLELTEVSTGVISNKVRNVIPHKCSLKYNYRFPYTINGNTTWTKIQKQIEKYVDSKKCTVDISLHNLSEAVYVSPDNDLIKIASTIAEKVYRHKPLIKAEGGSIAIVNLIKENVTPNILLFGFADLDSNMHGPNENMRLENITKGIEFTTQLVKKLDEEGIPLRKK